MRIFFVRNEVKCSDFLREFQRDSMLFVWVPDSDTKCTLWLMVQCAYPSASREEYTFQQSDRIVVPSNIHFVMIGIKVATERSVTGVKKHFGRLLSHSIPPNTHTPSTRFPRLYSRFPNFDSSISTILPGPPIGSDCFWRRVVQTSRKKIVEINHRVIAQAGFKNDNLLWITLCPEVNNFCDNGQWQMRTRKVTVLSGWNFTIAQFIIASPH